jgi:hypothetical protein
MGVDKTTYIMFGIKTPYFYDDDKDDRMDELGDTTGDVCIITDGMGGDYCLIGKCMYVADDYHGDEEYQEIRKINTINIDTLIQGVCKEMNVDYKVPTYFIQTHYS